MASDTSLVFNLVARERVTQALGPVAAKLQAFGTRITSAVAGVGVAAPYVAAAAVAAGGLAAGALAAGVAVSAFKAAAAPQLEEVTNAWNLYEAAQKAAAEGGDKAAEAQKAYTEALAQMPPATRATAEEFVGLKSDFKTWSDSLSSTTMPIFTRGIQALRAALPSLTPLVQSAAGALGGFVDEIATGLKSDGFKTWIADFAAAAGPALSNFLAVVKNIAVGVGALLHAFLPMSAGVTGGLAQMTEGFATWAKGLEGSAGFAKFLDLARSGQGALGNLGTAFGDLLVSLAPFLGATAIVAQTLADVIGAVPPGVITVLAQAFIAASVGMKAWAIATAIWSGVQRVATAVQWAMNTALFASPITWIIIAIVALVAAIVIIATKTTWFQTIWSTVWGAITEFVSGQVEVIGGILAWFGELPGKFAGWFGTAKDWAIAKLTDLVTWLNSLPLRAGAALGGLAVKLWNVGYDAFQNLKDAAVNRAVSLHNWIAGLPGRLVGALGGQAYRFYNMGLDFVYGLWDGISAAGGWLWSQVSNFASNNIVDPVKDFLHIGSPSKLAADEIGHWIPAGIAMGVEDNASVVDDAMRGLVNPAAYRPTAPLSSGRAPLAGGIGGAQRSEVRFVVEFVGGNRAFREWFQESVRISAGGSVIKFAEG